MDQNPLLLVVAAACLAASVLWGRAALRLERLARRVELESPADSPGAPLARSASRKNGHAALLYWLAGIAAGATALGERFAVTLFLLLLPAGLSFAFRRQLASDASAIEERNQRDRRAQEVLAQEELAPLRWAARLAPEVLPEVPGFELGTVYEPGSGAMAGDFYDVHPIGPGRLAVVIGDVSGHGIDPSITAFQVKYLLRVFLRQYRDPAQALEELNGVLSANARPDDLVSMCAVVVEPAAGSLRYASAGHPPAWLWHDGEVRALPATGPLLTLDPKGTYTSRELPMDPGDVLLLYTDGLAEARDGSELFGEDRVAAVLRRDPGQAAGALCKNLLEAARDFASEPLSDDIAILTIRRT